jgi:hypothetical protein
VYVIRDLVSEVESKQLKAGADPEFTPEELEAVRQKLKNLGYL